MADQSRTTDQHEDIGGGRMVRNPAIRRLLKVVAVVFVLLSLLFVNLYGRGDLRAITISQQRWIHGWPVTWLYRSWQPHYCDVPPEVALYHPDWPWSPLLGELRDYVVWAMFVDAAVAAAILLAVMRGIGLSPGGRRFRADVATAAALLSFFALPTLLATYLPGILTFLANSGVFFAVLFAAYTVWACVFRRVGRGGVEES